MQGLHELHELHAAAVGGIAYAVTKNPRLSITTGVGANLYMSLIGHGLPFSRSPVAETVKVDTHLTDSPNLFRTMDSSIQKLLTF